MYEGTTMPVVPVSSSGLTEQLHSTSSCAGFEAYSGDFLGVSSYGMWRRVGLVRTDVSEERGSSSFGIERTLEQI
jgi:hypothetical protein